MLAGQAGTPPRAHSFQWTAGAGQAQGRHRAGAGQVLSGGAQSTGRSWGLPGEGADSRFLRLQAWRSEDGCWVFESSRGGLCRVAGRSVGGTGGRHKKQRCLQPLGPGGGDACRRQRALGLHATPELLAPAKEC